MPGADDVVVLGPAECRELLAADVVGRVGFLTPAGPRVVPVNYAVLGEGLEFRTTSTSELAVYAAGTDVAFEVDHLDGQRQRGWSVMAHGRCERIHVSVHPELPGPRPWSGAETPVLLRIEWRELTGRRVGGERWPHPVVSDRGQPGPQWPTP